MQSGAVLDLRSNPKVAAFAVGLILYGPWLQPARLDFATTWKLVQLNSARFPSLERPLNHEEIVYKEKMSYFVIYCPIKLVDLIG
jgi:hypothetical protein